MQPGQGSNLLLHWKHRVLTTGAPGKSQLLTFLNQESFCKNPGFRLLLQNWKFWNPWVFASGRGWGRRLPWAWPNCLGSQDRVERKAHSPLFFWPSCTPNLTLHLKGLHAQTYEHPKNSSKSPLCQSSRNIMWNLTTNIVSNHGTKYPLKGKYPLCCPAKQCWCKTEEAIMWSQTHFALSSVRCFWRSRKIQFDFIFILFFNLWFCIFVLFYLWLPFACFKNYDLYLQMLKTDSTMQRSQHLIVW